MEKILQEEAIRFYGLADARLVALYILAAFWTFAFVFGLFWRRLVGPIARRLFPDWAEMVLPYLRRIVVWGLVLKGIHAALEQLPYSKQHEELANYAGNALAVVWIIILVSQAMGFFGQFYKWYITRAEMEGGHLADATGRATLYRKLTNFAILVLGGLYILRALDMDISPLLAGGAIGGLAIGLALQDTLANTFAGFYLTADRPFRVGDFIKLESGEEGFVEEIGWRNTKVKLFSNNLIIIPNSKLSQSTILNYFMPEQEMSVYINCGVSYDSDLEKAERVAIDVGKQVQNRVAGCNPDWEPLVRWQEFSESSIKFVTILRVRDFTTNYLLKSEFIKALHKRFLEENIEIPFPIRTVILKNQADSKKDSPETISFDV